MRRYPAFVPVRLSSPSVARNREPILAVLAPLCEPMGGARRSPLPSNLDGPGGAEVDPVRILEIASGSGEHAAYFASQLPHVVWQPSDRDLDGLESIDAYRLEAGVKNVLPPLCLDARHPFRFPVGNPASRTAPPVFHGLVCINMIHISPWDSTTGLFDNAQEVLGPSGFVLLYGPFRRGGKHTAESNARFDTELRIRDPEWGVRCLDEVTDYAKLRGFSLERATEMPRDNLTVVFRKVTPSREP